MRAVEYWRSRLSPSDAVVYDEMRDALRAHMDTADLHIDNPQNIQTVIQYLLHDHPELYWVSTRIGISQCTSRPRFGYGQPATVSYKGVFSSIYPKGRLPGIDAAINKVLLGFLQNKGKSEEEQFENIASYLAGNVTYEINNQTNQNAANALVFHRAQCSGFAAAFKLIADALGLWCIIVSGTAASDPKRPTRQEPHAWNIVRIQNVYYHVDPTNCASYNKGGSFSDKTFFGRSDDDFAPTHTWDKNTSPLCPTTLASSKSSPVIGSKSNVMVHSLYELRMLVREKLSTGAPFELNFDINITPDENKQLSLVQDCLRHCLGEFHRAGATISLTSRGGTFHLIYKL